ncbi:unnamed protein product, partial [Musa banksii]
SELPGRLQKKSLQGREESSLRGDTSAGCNCGGSHTAADNVVEERAQIKHDFESVASRIKLPSDHSFPNGSRAKQRSTEAEKEERRLPRVLADRESARQTILRRQ